MDPIFHHTPGIRSIQSHPLPGQGSRPTSSLPLRDSSLSLMGHSFQRGEEVGRTDRQCMGNRDQQRRTQTDCFGHAGLGQPCNFLNQHPVSVSAALQGHSSEQCGKTKTAVPAGCLRCSHSSARCRVPRVIKYAEGCWSPLYHSQKCHVLRVG